jgi:hypothetical protein
MLTIAESVSPTQHDVHLASPDLAHSRWKTRQGMKAVNVWGATGTASLCLADLSSLVYCIELFQRTA